jgi:hypothetical protein
MEQNVAAVVVIGDIDNDDSADEVELSYEMNKDDSD